MLTIAEHPVGAVAARNRSSYRAGMLGLDLDGLRSLVEADARIVSCELQIVDPGERTRVTNVLDVFDARRKRDGATYPGFDGPPRLAGEGHLDVFRGFQVVATGLLPAGEGGLMVSRRMFMDFWGEGAKWSPLAGNHTLVMSLDFADDVDDKATVDDASRRALINVSTAIGALASESPDGPGTTIEVPATWERDGDESLPRVAYVYQVQSQGPLLDTFLYGNPVDGLYPTLVEPAEIFDGALVSGNHQRLPTPTFLHCNNPVLRELLAKNGRRFRLAPVVIMEGHHISSPAKDRSASRAAQLLRCMNVDGAVLTQEGGGMSVVDQMLTIERAEELGIHCVAIATEMAGPAGDDRPLIHYTREARHLVSSGNRDEEVDVEAPEILLGAERGGPSTEASEQVDLRGRIRVPVWCLYGSVAQVGAGHVRARAV